MASVRMWLITVQLITVQVYRAPDHDGKDDNTVDDIPKWSPIPVFKLLS